MVDKRVWNAVLGCSLKNDRMISVHLQGKPFNITVIQVYAPTSNAEEPEVERFYKDLQDLLERTPKKDVLFIIGDWNAKVGSHETPGVTGKFGLGIQNEAGHRLIEFCQENALVIANTLFQQHKRRLYTWTSPDGQHWNQIDYILCILSPCLFNLYAEYIMRNAGLEDTQAGIKIAGRNINNLRYADDTTLMAEEKRN